MATEDTAFRLTTKPESQKRSRSVAHSDSRAKKICAQTSSGNSFNTGLDVTNSSASDQFSDTGNNCLSGDHTLIAASTTGENHVSGTITNPQKCVGKVDPVRINVSEHGEQGHSSPIDEDFTPGTSLDISDRLSGDAPSHCDDFQAAQTQLPRAKPQELVCSGNIAWTQSKELPNNELLEPSNSGNISKTQSQERPGAELQEAKSRTQKLPNIEVQELVKSRHMPEARTQGLPIDEVQLQEPAHSGSISATQSQQQANNELQAPTNSGDMSQTQEVPGADLQQLTSGGNNPGTPSQNLPYADLQKPTNSDNIQEPTGNGNISEAETLEQSDAGLHEPTSSGNISSAQMGIQRGQGGVGRGQASAGRGQASAGRGQASAGRGQASAGRGQASADRRGQGSGTGRPRARSTGRSAGAQMELPEGPVTYEQAREGLLKALQYIQDNNIFPGSSFKCLPLPRQRRQ